MALTIAGILTRDVITTHPETTLRESARLIANHHISCLIVADGKSVKGILTESDMVRASSLQFDMDSVTAIEFIDHAPITVKNNLSIYEAFDFLFKRHIRHLIVTDDEDQLEGLVTFTDIIRSISFDDYQQTKPVSAEMSTLVATVEQDTPVLEAVSLMNSRRISCVIVIKDNKPVGIFTERDAARMIVDRIDIVVVVIKDVMSSPLKKLPVSASLLEASDIMREEGIRRLVIVDERGLAAGVLSQFDVIRGLESQRIQHFKALHERSEEKRIEIEQLLAEKTELQRIVNASPAILYRCEWKENIDAGMFVSTYVSPSISAQLGYDQDECLRPDWWISHIHPDDASTALLMQTSLFDKGEVEYVYRFANKSGDWRWIRDHVRLLKDTDGKPFEMIGSWLDISEVRASEGKFHSLFNEARDITERLKNEEQMRLLESAVASVNESIIITDDEGVIEYVNPGFTRNTGYTIEDAMGNTPAMLNSKQQTQGFYEKFWQTIKDGKPWEGRILDRKKDGTVFPVHLSVAPIFGDSGEITHFVAVHEDLTEAELMQKKMMQSQKMEAVGTMVGGVAHDFNNLLASIVGNLYLMRNHHKDDAKTVSRIRGMESSVQQGAQLIQQMLTFARRDRTEMHVLDLNAFVKEAFNLAHASVPENISFKLDDASGKDFWIRGDATQLQQVLLNLVTNALHAVKDSAKPSIAVTLDFVAPGSLLLASHAEMTNENGWCCLSCSDNGCGMTADLVERIFEPFYTTKAVGEGTGLGLAMIYGAVQNHKGIIDVQSSPEEGTRFLIYLPLHKDKGARVTDLDDAEVDGQGLTVLLVDDDESLRQVLADVLRYNGFSVLEAIDGEHAVEMFERHETSISLVLMDVVMPNKGGVVAAKEIRAINATVPIIFQTGYGEQTKLEAATVITNSDSLQKPVQLSVLMKLILGKIHG